MTQVIARIYADGEKAASAAREAKTLGYGDSQVFVCGPSTGTAKADYVATLRQTGMGAEEADGCADEVEKGRSVVVVPAAFGGGAKATAALDKFDPIGAPPTKFATTGKAADSRGTRSTDIANDAAPLSNWLGWRTLIDSPTLFSDYFKMSVLTPFKSSVHVSDGTTTKVDLIQDPAPLSRSVGMRTLLDEPAPFSRWLGWRLILDDPAPLSRRLNMRVLSD